MRNMIRSTITIVAAGLILVACGERPNPVDSGIQPFESSASLVVPNPTGTEFIVFGDAALARAKSALTSGSTYIQTETQMVKASKKAKLKVKFKKYKAPMQVRNAVFKIAKKSIGGVDPLWEDYHEVGMAVETGQTLADVIVKFRPAGMTFDPVAILELNVKGELDPEALVAYHVSRNGKVTKPALKVEGRKTTWKLRVEVSSFSEYSWDEEADEAPTFE